MVLQTICFARYSLTDHAMDNPSKVDVPLPISSSKTREFDVSLNQRYKAENSALILQAIQQGIPIEQADRFERLGEIENELFRYSLFLTIAL